jgi:hypothetical protein
VGREVQSGAEPGRTWGGTGTTRAWKEAHRLCQELLPAFQSCFNLTHRRRLVRSISQGLWRFPRTSEWRLDLAEEMGRV